MAVFPEGRFYEQTFPELEDVVVVQVKRIVPMGAYVSLLEYDGQEGMMLLSELSKRRIRSVSKLLKVGRTEICMVLRVDEDKGYVDLSKRRVAPEDATAKEESFAKAKAVHGIMRHVASMNEIEVEELCNKVSWPLYAKYKDAFEAFRRHINDEINLWDEIDFSQPGTDLSHLADKIKSDIDLNLKRKLIQQALRLRAKVEVSCSEYEGIDAIKEALLKGTEASKEDCEIKIKLVAHPLFSLSTVCRDKSLGMATMEQALQMIKESIESKGGVCTVKLAPELVGQDEREDAAEDGDDSDASGSSESTESDQDETMGAIDEKALEELEKRAVDEDDGDDDVK